MEANMEKQAGQQTPGAKESAESLAGLVVDMMRAGMDKSAIVDKLVANGAEKSDAYRVVEDVYAQVVQLVRNEQFTTGSFPPAILGGGLAALIGGGLWSIIVILTNFEIGFVAWGIGWLAGFAVSLLTGGKKGFPAQIIAVTSGVSGVVLGKYLIFYHFLKQALEEKGATEALAQLSVFSMRLGQLFVENLADMVSPYDALWLFLAVATAWRMTKGSGIKLPDTQQMPSFQGPIIPKG